MSLPHGSFRGEKNNVAIRRIKENLAVLEDRLRKESSPQADDVASFRNAIEGQSQPSPRQLPPLKAALGPYNGLRFDVAKMLRSVQVAEDGSFSASFEVVGNLYVPATVSEACFRLADQLDS